CSCAHILHVTRADYRAVAHAVAVLQRAFQDVGDDLHIAVRMRGKPRAACDAVVVHDAQGAEMNVRGVVIIGERKGKARIEPAVVGMAARVALANENHGGLLAMTGRLYALSRLSSIG